MRLLAKFNIVLITIFGIGMIGVCAVTNYTLQRNAQAQVADNARMMMEAAGAMRSYTNEQITPLLKGQEQTVFFPQTVPAYAATENFNSLHAKYPQYSYKEATLNPTNPRDRATDWEADVVNQLRAHPEQTEFIGKREGASGETLCLARPIRITNPTCLTCHSTPDQAPASMIAKYGSSNGFNWQLNDVVGAQIIAVPTSLPQQMARKTFTALIGSLLAVLIVTLLVLNVLLNLLIIRPALRLSKAADDVSRGAADISDIPVSGKDEIAGLASSFNRMLRSLKKAIAMIEEE